MAMVGVPSGVLAWPKVKVEHGSKAAGMPRVSCFSKSTLSETKSPSTSTSTSTSSVFDNLFLSLFRNKMVQETGWDSQKPGYEGLIEVAHRLTLAQDNSQTRDAAVRILRSLFPPLLLELYRMLVAPIDGGKFAALMVARVTALSCQWLMGPCSVNSVDLPNGSSLMSGCDKGGFQAQASRLLNMKWNWIELCSSFHELSDSYPLLQFKVFGMKSHAIFQMAFSSYVLFQKMLTTFFKDHMGVPLLMEPNFTDYSCQFKFGILPPQQEFDDALKEPCLEICPNAVRRKEMNHSTHAHKCPRA
ncbi:putative peptidyl-prolyl cis-trans isomerase CYP21-3, mitochondrial-like [Capsicum annuum]|nr:putative peptidyl-prolyl cis-trans isomerase CYP21-3, mitochondrial-like [Capsicum annuum]